MKNKVTSDRAMEKWRHQLKNGGHVSTKIMHLKRYWIWSVGCTALLKGTAVDLFFTEVA